MEERAERALGIRLAKKHGLVETTQYIEKNKCYEVIFNTAVSEAGLEKAVSIVAESKNPGWAYWFVRSVPNLTEEMRARLRSIR